MSITVPHKWVRLTVTAIIIIFILIPSGLLAQRVEWERLFRGSGAGQLISIDQAHDSGYISAGVASVNGTPEFNAYVVRTGDLGDTLWTRQFAFSDTLLTYGSDIIRISDGGYLLAGYYLDSKYRAFLLKMSNKGDSIWSRSFDLNTHCFTEAVCETRKGDYAVTGYIRNSGEDKRLFVLKTNSNGDSLWMAVYSDGDFSRGYDIIEDTDSGLVIAGYAGQSDRSNMEEMLILRFKSDGEEDWAFSYGGAQNERGYSIRQTPDKGFITGGYTESFDAEDYDFLLVRTDSKGGLIWMNRYDLSGIDIGRALEITPDSGFLTVGYSYIEDNETFSINNRLSLLKTDAKGNEIWKSTLTTGNLNRFCRAMTLNQSGWPVIAGFTDIDSTNSERNPDPLIMQIGINNTPMVFPPLGTFTAIEGSDYRLNMTVYDIDDDTLDIEYVYRPDDNALYINNGDGSGQFSYMPDYHDVDRAVLFEFKYTDQYSIIYDTLFLQVSNRLLTSALVSSAQFDDILVTEKPIQIRFNEAVDVASLFDNITLSSTKNDILNFRYDAFQNVLLIENGSNSFIPLDTINVTLGRGIKDLAGYPINSNQTYTIAIGPVVYPGDTDNNGLVDENDLLPLIRFWETSGSPRNNYDDINWMPSPAHQWPDCLAVYADSDGDGTVCADDICAIAMNWNKSVISGTELTPPEADEISDVLERLDIFKVKELYLALIGCPGCNGKTLLTEAFESLLGSYPGGMPTDIELFQNYPNPFNPETAIRFYLPEPGEITLAVYNIIGQKVAVLYEGYHSAGYDEITWTGIDQTEQPVATGIYFYRLDAEELSLTKRMTLIR